ncbi:TPA: 2Fe-2S iron-sulfur cluster-binding protein [Salmonella enterica subsp. enterica serovar Muenchen]
MESVLMNGREYLFPLGVKFVDVIDDIEEVDSLCHQGKCGKCLVLIESGNFGDISENEKRFLDLMGLSSQKYRLLCQCTLGAKTIIKTLGDL